MDDWRPRDSAGDASWAGAAVVDTLPTAICAHASMAGVNNRAAHTGASPTEYTALGELLCGHGEDPEGCEPGWPGGSAPEGFPRYEYAGLWGYESAGFGEDPFGLGTDRSLLALGGVNPRLAPIRLLHVGWRWYQPDIGRFIQRDPLGIAAGLNVYSYCHANPLVLVDADGEVVWLIVAGIILAAGGIVGSSIEGCSTMQQAGDASRLAVDEAMVDMALDQGRAYPYGDPLYDWAWCIGRLAEAPGTSAQGPNPPGLPMDGPSAAGPIIDEAIRRSGLIDPVPVPEEEP